MPDIVVVFGQKVDCICYDFFGGPGGLYLQSNPTCILFLVKISHPDGRGLERLLVFDSLKDVHMAEYKCRASNFYNRDAEGRRVEVEVRSRLTVICEF